MKLTQELINTLQGIHDGKPWQWGDSKDSWIDAIDRNNAIGLMSSGYRIRLKPEPDPYAELKAAHAAGETIEHLIDWKWFTVPFPSWTFPIERYRIKPKSVRVPLGPEDVPPGSVLRGNGEVQYHGWCIITSCSLIGIRIWRECDNNPTEITWQTIKDAESEINRSLPLTGKWDANAWEPCWKEVQP